jgi:hypothetical protein
MNNNINQYGTFFGTARRLVFNNNNAVNEPSLHALFIPTNHVKLNKNNRPVDPISLHHFKKGDVAIRVGNKNPIYIRTLTFNKAYGTGWKHLNQNSTNIVLRHPLTRGRVLRKNIRKVRFV